MWKIWWLRGLGKEGGRKQIKWKGYENRIEDRGEEGEGKLELESHKPKGL